MADRHPDTTYDANYPYNKTFVSESGHGSEIDDTPGKERLRVWHRSGTYHEISADGKKVELVKGDHHVYVAGGQTTTVDGNHDHKTEGHSRQSIGGGSHTEVAGDSSLVHAGDHHHLIKGSHAHMTGGESYTNVQGNASTKIAGNSNHESGMDHSTKIGGTMNVNAGGDQKVTVSGSMTTNVAGGMTSSVKGDTSFSSDSGSFSLSHAQGSLTTTVKNQTTTVSQSMAMNISNALTITAQSATLNGQALATIGPSDINLKEHVMPIYNCLERVMDLTPVSFFYKDKDRFGNDDHIGFIAQEVVRLSPEVIGRTSDDMMTVDLSRLVTICVGAIQTLEARIKFLEDHINSLT